MISAAALLLLSTQAAAQAGSADHDVPLFQELCTQGQHRFNRGEVQSTSFAKLPAAAKASLVQLWFPNSPPVPKLDDTAAGAGIYHILRGARRKRYLAVEERTGKQGQRVKVCSLFTENVVFERVVSDLEPEAKTDKMKPYAYSPHPGGWLTGRTTRWFQKSSLGYTIVVQRLSGHLVLLQSQLPL